MKNKILLVVMLTVLYTIVYVFVDGRKENWLVGPKLMQQTDSQNTLLAPQSSPTPNIPKAFKFDSSTDLEAELEIVNPQVLDSDFE